MTIKKILILISFIGIVFFSYFIKTIAIDDFVNIIIKQTSSNYFELNSKNEYQIGQEIFKINKLSCQEIKSGNYTYFLNKGTIFKLQGGKYCFSNNFSSTKKNLFSNYKILNFNLPIIKEDGKYSIFKFSEYFSSNDISGFYDSDLEQIGADKTKIIILKTGNKYFIVKKYQKYQIDENLLENIKYKNKFLSILYDDIRSSNYNDAEINETLLKIKKIGEDFKNSKNKLLDIYTYTLNNLYYSKIDYNNFPSTGKIFSGIQTFQNGNGVCDGYTKLFFYLGMFSGLDNIEIKKGFVINSEYFPKIGHSWIKYNNLYFDPTFEDTSLSDNKLNLSKNYKYFGLPKEIFYADRFDFSDDKKLKDYKNLNIDERKKIVDNNYLNVSKNYQMIDGYKIILPYINKIKYGITEKITLNNSLNYITSVKLYEGKGYIEDIKTKKINYIKKITYFDLKNENELDEVIKNSFNYDLNGLYLIYFYKNDGNITIKLSNEISLK